MERLPWLQRSAVVGRAAPRSAVARRGVAAPKSVVAPKSAARPHARKPKKPALSAGFFSFFAHRSSPARSPRVPRRRQIDDSRDERLVRHAILGRRACELALALQIAIRIHLDHV